jgi:DNA-binding CsgD family transcriptional regulator
MTAAIATLTRREREVCVMLLLGLSQKQAGQRLGIGARSVERYSENARRKLGVKGRIELVRRLYEVAT